MSKGTCSVEGCDRPAYSLTWCRPHWQRQYLSGELRPDIPIAPRRPTRGTCQIPQCGRPHYSLGYCLPHYRRWRKSGDVRPTVPVASRQPRMGTCTVTGCSRRVRARGLCNGHYARVLVKGDAEPLKPLRPTTRSTCAVAGCVRRAVGYGWCATHYGPYRLYRLTPADLQSLTERQGGRCAGCGRTPAPNSRLYVDHDHRCCQGKITCGRCVRGLLCSDCNLALGVLNDSEQSLLGLASYVRSWARNSGDAF